ncbi:MAG: nucleoside monophosphate kinase [Candidatus Paceibacterota bacterium]|jgi:adenylate kinase
MNVVIMVGTTGAGKSTHGKLLAEKYGYSYVSSGAIARSLMDENTARSFASGGLSPHDDAITDAIKERFSGEMLGIVLDGFPRNEYHVEKLRSWANIVGANIRVIYINVPMPLIKERILSRHRDEFDTEEALAGRHEIFLKETFPIINRLVWEFKYPAIEVALTQERPIDEIQTMVDTAYRTELSKGEWRVFRVC